MRGERMSIPFLYIAFAGFVAVCIIFYLAVVEWIGAQRNA